VQAGHLHHIITALHLHRGGQYSTPRLQEAAAPPPHLQADHHPLVLPHLQGGHHPLVPLLIPLADHHPDLQGEAQEAAAQAVAVLGAAAAQVVVVHQVEEDKILLCWFYAIQL